jgi:membrane-associated protein
VAASLLDWLIHLNTHLLAFSHAHGAWVYALLFAVIFLETGLVFAPFLPGDSLLFICGTLAASGAFPLAWVLPLLMAASIAGDAVNFAIGSRFGHRIEAGHWRWPKPHHMRTTHQFFARHGGKTIFIARFVPIVRTLAPFVAGMGSMGYGRFAAWNVSGAVVWVGGVTMAGYLFGNIGWVKHNFTLALLAIIVLSLLPGALVGGKNWLGARKAQAGPNSGRDGLTRPAGCRSREVAPNPVSRHRPLSTPSPAHPPWPDRRHRASGWCRRRTVRSRCRQIPCRDRA